MRKHLVWIIAAAVAVSATGVAFATDTSGSDFSALKLKVKPSKGSFSKKDYKGSKLSVETSTLSNSNPGTPTHPGTIPVATSNVKLKFDKDIKFQTKGLAQCSAGKVTNTTTEQAKSKCGKATVGKGSATACIGANPNPCGGLLSFVVTAFNGKPKSGKPTIVLHSRNDTNNLTVVLVGTLDQKKNTLNVPIPKAVYKLSTITDFKTTVEKSYKAKVNGKKKKFKYVSARCSHKKLTLNGTFSYSNGDPSDNVSAKSKCST
jgi:hypothetical protein